MLAPRHIPADEIDWVATFWSVFWVVAIAAVVALVSHQRRMARRREAEEAARAAAAKQARWDDLCRRFGPEVAARIYRGDIWQGQTEEMLFESMGRPVDFDEKVMKTKTRRVYKWGRMGANRFATRVTVENGVVVGWDI